jgi:hypothetical protein
MAASSGKNGDGNVEDLDERRAQDGPLDPDAAGIEARAEAGVEEEDDGQLGFVVGDEPLKLSKLIKSGIPVESEVSLMSAAVPTDGLLDPTKEGVLLVSYSPSKYECVPVRENGRVTRWKIRQQVRPTDVRTANEEALREHLDVALTAA